MEKLRLTIQRQIMDELDNGCFTSDDFIVLFDNEAEDVVFSINFKHDPSFYLYIEYRNNTFYIRISPGSFQQNEYRSIPEFRSAIAELQPWCVEVRRELKASKPIYREIDDLREIIENLITGESEEDEFSVEEINELHRKFDELNARVEELEKQQVITTKQKEEFTGGVAQVSEDLESYPKKTWIKTSSTKLVRLVSNIGKSPEGRKLLASGAKKFLGLD